MKSPVGNLNSNLLMLQAFRDGNTFEVPAELAEHVSNLDESADLLLALSRWSGGELTKQQIAGALKGSPNQFVNKIAGEFLSYEATRQFAESALENPQRSRGFIAGDPESIAIAVGALAVLLQLKFQVKVEYRDGKWSFSLGGGTGGMSSGLVAEVIKSFLKVLGGGRPSE